MSSSHFIKIYKELKNILQEDKLTKRNIIVVTANLMQAVEKYGNKSDVKLTGLEKKEFIIKAIITYIEREMDDGSDESLIILQFTEITLGVFIDTLINVDNKKFRIKTQKCVDKLFCCF